jgi:hypothetical protein
MIAARRKQLRPRDPSPLIKLERGDIAQRGDRVGVVAACAVSRVLLWPVRWEAPERAADIPVTGWLDATVLGNPKQAMVQAGVLLDVPLTGQRRLGRASRQLLDLVARAAARDAATSAVIRLWSGDRERRRDQCTLPTKAL